jgi:hypothetical protein
VTAARKIRHITNGLVTPIPANLLRASNGVPRQRLSYRRFATAAEVIRFAAKDSPAVRMLGAWMQVGDERFNSEEIHRPYESGDCPLRRRTV